MLSAEPSPAPSLAALLLGRLLHREEATIHQLDWANAAGHSVPRSHAVTAKAFGSTSTIN